MNKRLSALQWAALGMALVLPGVCQAATGHQLLDGFLKGLVSFQAKFVQRVTDEQGAQQQDSSGVVYLQRPGRFRWDYEKPYRQLIVADGKKVWVYDPELKQVTVKALDTALGNTPALLLGGDVDIGAHFDVSDGGTKDGLTWVWLKPKGRDNQYSAIGLGFDGERLAVMQLSDNLGQITSIRFSDEHRNPKLDPTLFEFTPPPGVDVLDAGNP